MIGGYAALIWQVLSILLSWYQEFSYSNELTNALFTREKEHRLSQRQGQVDKETSGPQDLDHLTLAEQAVLNREPHDYCVVRRTLAKILRCCCCCLSGKAWYRKIIKIDDMNCAIEEGLAAQMDIVDILRWFRVFKFVSIANLRKN